MAQENNYRLDIPWLVPAQYLPSYSFQVGYVYCLNKNIPHIFSFNPTIGLWGGIESFHGDLPGEVVRMKKNYLLLECYLALQAEIILTPSLSVYLEPRGVFRLQTADEKHSFNASLEFKFYIPR